MLICMKLKLIVNGQLIVAVGVNISLLCLSEQDLLSLQLILHHVNMSVVRREVYHIIERAIKNGEKEEECTLTFAILPTWWPPSKHSLTVCLILCCSAATGGKISFANTLLCYHDCC